MVRQAVMPLKECLEFTFNTNSHSGGSIDGSSNNSFFLGFFIGEN